MGAVCGQFRTCDWDEDFRSLGAAQGTPEKIGFRPGTVSCSSETAIGQDVSMPFSLKEAAVEKATPGVKSFESNGRSSPLGATVVPGGANFSLFSRSASAVELLLFDREDDPRPARVITIDLVCN